MSILDVFPYLLWTLTNLCEHGKEKKQINRYNESNFFKNVPSTLTTVYIKKLNYKLSHYSPSNVFQTLL